MAATITPYNAMASAKIKMSSIPIKIFSYDTNFLTPVSPTSPIAYPAKREEKP